MRLYKWLYPGLKVKRWFFLSFLGVVLFTVGLGLLSAFDLVVAAERELTRLVAGLWGWREGALSLLGVIFIVLGLGSFILGINRAFHSIGTVLLPENQHRLPEIIFARRFLQKGPRIVVIGGGTGLSVLLRGLKEYTSNLTAIVSVADDGGSSGMLRGELGILPPGDIRNCLVALADTEALMERVLQYRFPAGNMAGHNLGNLLLAALAEVSGGFQGAIHELSKVLAIRGRVLPATLAHVVLCARLADGRIVEGESKIPKAGRAIEEVFLQPDWCLPVEEALEAIAQADAIVLGPGSLYTSVLPPLLVKGMVTALRQSPAPKIYVTNIMTQPGETDGYTASRHVKALYRHLGPDLLDWVVVNVGAIPRDLQNRYLSEGAQPVRVDLRELEKLKVKVAQERLVDRADVVRHHPEGLALAILKIILQRDKRDKR